MQILSSIEKVFIKKTETTTTIWKKTRQLFSGRGQQGNNPYCMHPTPPFSSIKLCPNLLMIALLKEKLIWLLCPYWPENVEIRSPCCRSSSMTSLCLQVVKPLQRRLSRRPQSSVSLMLRRSYPSLQADRVWWRILKLHNQVRLSVVLFYSRRGFCIGIWSLATFRRTQQSPSTSFDL